MKGFAHPVFLDVSCTSHCQQWPGFNSMSVQSQTALNIPLMLLAGSLLQKKKFSFLPFLSIQYHNAMVVNAPLTTPYTLYVVNTVLPLGEYQITRTKYCCIRDHPYDKPHLVPDIPSVPQVLRATVQPWGKYQIRRKKQSVPFVKTIHHQSNMSENISLDM